MLTAVVIFALPLTAKQRSLFPVIIRLRNSLEVNRHHLRDHG